MTNIDLRIGEASVIGEIAHYIFSINGRMNISHYSDFEYNPGGHKQLVRFLEDKHNCPIIITNGANQGLRACFQVLKNRGHNNMGIRAPYWNRIPRLLELIDYNYSVYQGGINPNEPTRSTMDSCLTVIPNNPDGFVPTTDNIKLLELYLKEEKIPLIHDAVYYNGVYMPIGQGLDPIGDMQIFSASKSFGLSGLRIGYIAVRNPVYYKDLYKFMEEDTVGVSILSQKMYLDILRKEKEIPFLNQRFEREARNKLSSAREIIKGISSSLVEFPESFKSNFGMFAWVKILKEGIFEKANVDVLDGSSFGMPAYIRINLGVGDILLKEAVQRINDANN